MNEEPSGIPCERMCDQRAAHVRPPAWFGTRFVQTQVRNLRPLAAGRNDIERYFAAETGRRRMMNGSRVSGYGGMSFLFLYFTARSADVRHSISFLSVSEIATAPSCFLGDGVNRPSPSTTRLGRSTEDNTGPFRYTILS
ncbi:hypothetical protein MTO96_003359 [Rhipicephalus appendiculatus]